MRTLTRWALLFSRRAAAGEPPDFVPCFILELEVLFVPNLGVRTPGTATRPAGLTRARTATARS